MVNTAIAIILYISIVPSACAQSDTSSLKCQQLPALPHPTGFAAPFAGVSNGALIVAGGANFPGAMPWEGGQKVWHDSVFVLPAPGGQWISGFKLSRPIAYGVSVTCAQGILCAGGSDSHGHSRDVFLLQWTNNRIETKPLPALPRPMANGCGALVGNTVYLAGGTETPDATNAMKNFWALDLSKPGLPWRELDPWPGPARMLAVAGVVKGDFFLVSGVELHGSPNGKPVRRYLTDAFRFTHRKSWTRLADLPRAAAAAPSPAIAEDNQLLVVSGDDGALVDFEPKSRHPGFPKTVLAYDPRRDRWRNLGDSQLSRATAPVVNWRGRAVIVNGEVRPGQRTPEVWALNEH